MQTWFSSSTDNGKLKMMPTSSNDSFYKLQNKERFEGKTDQMVTAVAVCGGANVLTVFFNLSTKPLDCFTW